MAFVLDIETGVWTDTEADGKPDGGRKPGRPPKDKPQGE